MLVHEWLTANDILYHLVGITDDTHALYTCNRPTGGADRITMTIAADGSATDATGTILYTVPDSGASGFVFPYLNFPGTLTAEIDGNTESLTLIDALTPSDMRFRCLYHSTDTLYDVYQVSQGVYNVFRSTDLGLLYKTTVTV